MTAGHRAAALRLSAYPGIIWGPCSGLPYESHRLHAFSYQGLPVGGTAMIRATVLRVLMLTAAFAAALTPVTCLGESSNRLPTKATKELPPELLSLLRQKMPKHSPILVRLFKEEAELEVWKQDTTFPDSQDVSDLSVVGRSWAEVAGGRPSGSGGVLCSYAGVDESQLQLLSCD